MYNKIDIDILREFIDGEVHDIYLFVKKLYYKDMYMTIHDYCLDGLKNEDSIDIYINAALFDYKLQNYLNKSLKITDGKFFDEYLMNCIIGTLFNKYPDSKVLQFETKESFLIKLLEFQRKSLDYKMVSEHNISLLIGLLRNNFDSKNMYNIDDIIKFIKDLSLVNNESKEEEDFFKYLNKIIKRNNISLNQLGTESTIKKGIYEISLGKLPTKNQLIMLTIALNLDRNESNKIFELARKEVQNCSNSNIYSFEKDNKRDILIMHWLNNLDYLKEIAKKRNRNVINIFNEILKESNFDVLK